MSEAPETLYHDPDLAALYDPQNACAVRAGGRSDFDFVTDRAPQARSALDLGCGSGELAVSLAARRAVTGVDRAAAMLQIACNRPGGHRVRWFEADARSLDLGRRFDLIVLTGHAFQCFLTDADVARLLATAVRHLAPEGRFIFDTRNPETRYWEAWVPAGNERVFDGPNGPVRRVTNTRINAATGLVTDRQIYTLPDGSQRRTRPGRVVSTEQRWSGCLRQRSWN